MSASAGFQRDHFLWPKDISPRYKEAPWDCPVLAGRGIGATGTSWAISGVFSPCPQLLASASYDDTVKLYREEEDDWVCCATLEGHESTVWSLAFDPSGQRLASCSDDRTVRIWRQYLPGNEQGEGPGTELRRLLSKRLTVYLAETQMKHSKRVEGRCAMRAPERWKKQGRLHRRAISSELERMCRILQEENSG